MLRRHRGHRDQPARCLLHLARCRIGLHVVCQEVGGPLHHGVVTGQKLLVARVEIVLPDVRGQPGATRGEHAPGRTVHRPGNTPEVGVVVSHPAPTAVHLLGRLRSRLAQVANHREQRLLRLGQVSHQGRPVVHLGVDVDGIFRVPRCIHLVVPHALQVGRLAPRLRRRDEQVAPVLHHQRDHIQVGRFPIPAGGGIIGKGSQALVSFQGGVL